MTIKIKAGQAWAVVAGAENAYDTYIPHGIRVRIVRESDWRKLMKLVRAVEAHDWNSTERYALEPIYDALDALRGKK